MKRKFKAKICSFLIIVALFCGYLGFCSTRVLTVKGKAEFESMLKSASYVAIAKATDDISFKDLFTITTNADGNIQMLSSNSLKLNELSFRLADETLKACKLIEGGGVSIPIGAFTGISLLSGTGKMVNVKMIKIDGVKCEFVSRFLSSGINQTKHSLYLNIVPDCTLIIGLKRIKIDTKIQYLCYENLILGSVPETYITIANGFAK